MRPAARTMPLASLLLPLVLAGAPGLQAQAEGPSARGHELFPVHAGTLASVVDPGVLRAVDRPGEPATATGHTPVLGAAVQAFAVPTPAALQDRRARGTRFMIGGAVAVLVGSVVGGDGGTLFVVGGLVAAGYGFYLYHEP